MLKATSELLNAARMGGYSVGAFNVYNLEEVCGVLTAAQTLQSPVILQVLPKALELAGTGLIKLCLEAGRRADIPVAVQLDHCTSEAVISQALAAGVSSVMADGSHLPYEQNVAFTRRMVRLAGERDAMVEAELGRLAGTEDDWTVTASESCLTDPQQARDFVAQTNVAALAVCIGNVHGPYAHPPSLDYHRLSDIGKCVPVPLVLHGTSGLPDDMIQRVIASGICKLNVNTELRDACLGATGRYMQENDAPDLMDLMRTVVQAVSRPVKQKMALFGSVGKAQPQLAANSSNFNFDTIRGRIL